MEHADSYRLYFIAGAGRAVWGVEVPAGKSQGEVALGTKRNAGLDRHSMFLLSRGMLFRFEPIGSWDKAGGLRVAFAA